MKVFIDGVEVECHNDVKVVYENREIDLVFGQGAKSCDLHVTLTNEGMIADTFIEGEGESFTTMSQEVQDIIDETH
jgi:predicted RNA-binding protein with PIN domain